MTRLKSILFSVCALIVSMNSVWAAPELDWPKKPIPAIVSFPAGGSTDQSISSALFKNPPTDLQKDFVPVALIGTIPHLIVMNPSVPAKNLPELITFTNPKMEISITPRRAMAACRILNLLYSCSVLMLLALIFPIKAAALLCQT